MQEAWSWGHVVEKAGDGLGAFIRLCNIRFKRLENSLRELRGRPKYFYPEDFGLNPLSATAAVQAAANAAGTAGGGRVALFGTAYTFGSGITLTSAHDGVIFEGAGRETTTLSKGFSGDLFTLTAAPNVQFRHLTVDGLHGTYTGRGFVLTGASHRPAWRDVLLTGFTSEAIRFEADAGRRAWVEADFTPGTGQTDAKYVWIVGTDTVPCYRRFMGCIAEAGYFDVDGASDTIFDHVQVRRIEIDSASSITNVTGGLWGNSGSAMTINGTVTRIIGVRFSGDVTLANGMTGCFVNNVQTSGTFTNSTAINACLVRHHVLNADYHLVDQHKLYSGSTTGGVLRTGRTVAPGDADYTWNPYEGVSDLLYNTTLTVARAITLSTTSAFNGAAVLVRRTAGGAYLLDVGGLVNLAPMEWCWVVYTGSAYVVVAAGKVQQVGRLDTGLRVTEDDMSGTTQYGLLVDSVTQSDATTNGIGVYARIQTAAAAFTQATAASLYAANPSAGAGSTITTAVGLHVENITAGGTNNFAIRTGTGRHSFGDDIEATGGFRQTVDGWYQDNVTASQTDVELTRAVGRFRAVRAGSVTGVIVTSTEARTAGTLTVTVFKNTGLAGAAGSTIGLTAVLNGTDTSRKATTQAKDTDTFAAGDELYAVVTTDGSWTPTTADIRVAIEIED